MTKPQVKQLSLSLSFEAIRMPTVYLLQTRRYMPSAPLRLFSHCHKTIIYDRHEVLSIHHLLLSAVTDTALRSDERKRIFIIYIQDETRAETTQVKLDGLNRC